MKNLTRLGLIGILTVAGMSSAAASDWDRQTEQLTLTPLTYSETDTAEFQLVHRRSFRHSHRRGFHRGFRSRGFNRFGHRRYYYGSRFGFNRGFGFGHRRGFNRFGHGFRY